MTATRAHEASRQHRRGTCSCSRQPDLAMQRRKDRAAGRWPFGGPSLSTVRKWMRDLYRAEPQNVERTVQRTGKPGRPRYAYRWIGPPSEDKRTVGEHIVEERLTTILRRARGKPLTEDQIIDRYKAAMARRDKKARELEQATLSGVRRAAARTLQPEIGA